MRVAVESSAVLGVECGLRTATVELLRHLCRQNPLDEYLLYAARWKDFPPAGQAWPGPGEKPRNLALHLRRFPFGPMLRMEHSLGLSVQEPLLLPRVDVFHGAGQFLPRLRRTPSVLTLHHGGDMTHRATGWDRFYYGTVIRQSAAWADRVITVSEYTRRLCVERLRIPDEKVRVVYHGVFDPLPAPSPAQVAQARGRYGLPPRFVLCLSRLNPGKNVVRLVRAFRGAAARHKDLSLVLAGNADEGYLPEVVAAIRDSGLETRVVLTGSIPEADVPAVYAASEAFVFPSTSEGFGIPLIEAMAMGVPVAASSATSIPEVVGDAGLLFDPLDEDAIVGALLELVEDGARRADLVARGRARAKRFTWTESARATRAVYAELA